MVFKGSVKTSNNGTQVIRCKDRLKLTRRRLINHGYLEETVKGGFRALLSTESSSWFYRISLQLKCSSLCDGQPVSNDGSWLSPMVVDGRGGGLGYWVSAWGRREDKTHVFTLLDVFVTCKTCQEKFFSPRRAGPTQTCPGDFCSNIFHYFCAKVISHTLDVNLQIPMLKTCRHGWRAYSPNLKAIQRLMNLKWWFYQNRYCVNLRITQFQ